MKILLRDHPLAILVEEELLIRPWMSLVSFDVPSMAPNHPGLLRLSETVQYQYLNGLMDQTEFQILSAGINHHLRATMEIVMEVYDHDMVFQWLSVLSRGSGLPAGMSAQAEIVNGRLVFIVKATYTSEDAAVGFLWALANSLLYMPI